MTLMESVSPTDYGASSLPEAPMRVAMRCSRVLPSGLICNHKVASYELEDFEKAVLHRIEIECRRCGNVAKMADFM